MGFLKDTWVQFSRYSGRSLLVVALRDGGSAWSNGCWQCDRTGSIVFPLVVRLGWSLFRGPDPPMPESAMEWFRDACGLSGPLALKCQDQGRASDTATSYRLDGPFALIGRDPRSDLVLPSAQVSRRHAFLQVVGGGLFCIDLDSRTKLRWAGEDEPRVHGWLDPGREVRIGPYAIRWEGSDSRSQQPSGSPVPLASESLEETQSALASPGRARNAHSDRRRKNRSGEWRARSR